MIDTLVKMSGTTHEARIDQKTITRDNERVLNKNEGKISYTMSTKEKPVIDFNDFMFIQERNSIVIKAGGSPLWNKNETAYPMSWRLFKDTIKQPGKKYSLQTIPTNSTAKDFDVRKNQPDFFAMLNQRFAQAKESDKMKKAYLAAYDLTETELLRLDQNVVADDIMHGINALMFGITHRTGTSDDHEMSEEEMEMMPELNEYGEPVNLLETAEENTELVREAAIAQNQLENQQQKRYAGGHISRADLVSQSGGVIRQLDTVLADAYAEAKGYFDGRGYRVTPTGELVSENGELYVRTSNGANHPDMDALDGASDDSGTRVYSDGEETAETFYEVTDAFIKHLARLDDWHGLAEGRFELNAKDAYIRKNR